MESRGVSDEEGIRVQGTMMEPKAANPDKRRVYVTPEKMREHMITLFDRQIEEERELDLDSVQFFPDRVDADLSASFAEQSSEEARNVICFVNVLSVARTYLMGCCEHGMQGLPEEVADDDIRVLDSWHIGKRGWDAVCIEGPSYGTTKEVYQSIESIRVVSFRDQCRVRAEQRRRRSRAARGVRRAGKAEC